MSATSDAALERCPGDTVGRVTASAEVRSRARTRSGAPTYPVDRVVGERHHVQVAVGSLFDAGGGAEARSDLQGFALRAFEFLRPEKVVRNLVGKARIGTR